MKLTRAGSVDVINPKNMKNRTPAMDVNRPLSAPTSRTKKVMMPAKTRSNVNLKKKWCKAIHY